MKNVKDFTCKSCGRTDLVLPYGNPKSSILIIGEFPGEEEIKVGRPFVGPSGRVLKTELGRLGFSLHNAILTNLWLHEKNDDEACFNAGLENLLRLGSGKEIVLLLGSDTVSFFTDYSVMQVAGLVVDTPYFEGRVMACPNPTLAFYGAIGEVKLSLEKLRILSAISMLSIL